MKEDLKPEEIATRLEEIFNTIDPALPKEKIEELRTEFQALMKLLPEGIGYGWDKLLKNDK